MAGSGEIMAEGERVTACLDCSPPHLYGVSSSTCSSVPTSCSLRVLFVLFVMDLCDICGGPLPPYRYGLGMWSIDALTDNRATTNQARGALFILPDRLC